MGFTRVSIKTLAIEGRPRRSPLSRRRRPRPVVSVSKTATRGVLTIPRATPIAMVRGIPLSGISGLIVGLPSDLENGSSYKLSEEGVDIAETFELPVSDRRGGGVKALVEPDIEHGLLYGVLCHVASDGEETDPRQR